MNVFVGIPIYNGQDKLKDVIRRIPSDVSDYLIMVNDGSTDNSAAVISDSIKAYKHKFKRVTLLNHGKNKGYGASQKTIYRTFLKQAKKGDVIVLIHADGQNMPEEISVLVGGFTDPSIEVVLGSRALGIKHIKEKPKIKCRSMPLYKRIGDKFLTFCQNWAFGTHFSTFSSGFRAYRKIALQKLNFQSFTDRHSFDSEIVMNIAYKKLKVREVPVYPFYSDEISNFSMARYIFDIFVNIVKTRKQFRKK